MGMVTVRGIAIAVVLLASGVAISRGQVSCEGRSGAPPNETYVSITITSPPDGTTVFADRACSGTLVIEGTYVVTGPPPQYDFYIVIDRSGSTADDSGADVNQNGILGEVEDNIYHAEIQAAQDFVRALDPRYSRAAVISFGDVAVVHQALTPDLVAVDGVLESMKPLPLLFGTQYVPAMEAVKQEALTNGDLINRLQRCVFLSDGRQAETLPQVDAKAQELADTKIRIDTFALGFLTAPGLADMARITGGVFTPLLVPGDIVDLLPTFADAPAYDVTADNMGSGDVGTTIVDEAALTFSATVTLVPGFNIVRITIATQGRMPVVVECAITANLEGGIAARPVASVDPCGGTGQVRLDGSASDLAGCADATFRWLDCNGVEVCPPSPDPVCLIAAVPGCSDYLLEVSCPSEGCMAKKGASATPVDPPPVADVSTAACPLANVPFSCGTADPAMEYWWDFDDATDSDGNTDPSDDADATGCDVGTSWPGDGMRIVNGWRRDPSTGCVNLIARGTADISGATPPAETLDLRVAHAGASVTLSWSALPGAASYRPQRGTLSSLWVARAYDHRTDDSLGEGACDTAGATTWVDADDGQDGGKYYYLVSALNDCGFEGPLGQAWDGHVFTPHPPRLPTASCP